MIEQGLPVTFLLLFAVLICVLHLMILFSSPGNKVNQWCCIAGLVLSLGVWKEYIYYSGFFSGLEMRFMGMEYQVDELINSVLTAVIYYLGMPCGVICGLYFSGMDKRRPEVFRILRGAVFIPALVFAFVYPWDQTRALVYVYPRAFGLIAVYNLAYGMFMTALIVHTLIRERKSRQFYQRRFISVFILLPLCHFSSLF